MTWISLASSKTHLLYKREHRKPIVSFLTHFIHKRLRQQPKITGNPKNPKKHAERQTSWACLAPCFYKIPELTLFSYHRRRDSCLAPKHCQQYSSPSNIKQDNFTVTN